MLLDILSLSLSLPIIYSGSQESFAMNKITWEHFVKNVSHDATIKIFIHTLFKLTHTAFSIYQTIRPFCKRFCCTWYICTRDVRSMGVASLKFIVITNHNDTTVLRKIKSVIISFQCRSLIITDGLSCWWAGGIEEVDSGNSQPVNKDT